MEHDEAKQEESEGTNGNEVGIGGNKWESELTRRNKQGITEKEKGTTENNHEKGNHRKQMRTSCKKMGVNDDHGESKNKALNSYDGREQVGTK